MSDRITDERLAEIERLLEGSNYKIYSHSKEILEMLQAEREYVNKQEMSIAIAISRTNARAEQAEAEIDALKLRAEKAERWHISERERLVRQHGDLEDRAEKAEAILARIRELPEKWRQRDNPRTRMCADELEAEFNQGNKRS